MKLEPLIYVTDLEKSIQFYTKVLGFKLGKLFPNKNSPTYAPIYIGNNKLMLCLARKSNKKFYPKGLGGSGVQFFVEVDAIDEVWIRIKNQVGVVEEMQTKTWGDREFTLKDPDGYLISFYCEVRS